MANYTLNVLRGEKTQQRFELKTGETVRLLAEVNTEYLLLNENNVLLTQPETRVVGDDLWVFLLGDSETPALILENYVHAHPIVDAMQ